MVQISEDVLNILDAATKDGDLLIINQSLDRKLYIATNRVIEAAGGKWNRRRKAHVFEGEAIDFIEPILLTGEYQIAKQDFGQFDTPMALAHRVAAMADIQPGMKVLEPSAGIGNLVRAIVLAGGIPHAFEIDDMRRATLEASGLLTTPAKSGDFLLVPATREFDRVVMNPPFTRQADIRHVRHAFQFLKHEGKLVAITSNSGLLSSNRAAVEFRAFVKAQGGTIAPLPDNSFKESGTNVCACVVTMFASAIGD